MSDKRLSYGELMQFAKDNPVVGAWIEGMRKGAERWARERPPTEALGFRVRLREPTEEEEPSDEELRQRVRTFMASLPHAAREQPGECDCPPGVPVLATNPDRCPACGRLRRGE